MYWGIYLNPILYAKSGTNGTRHVIEIMAAQCSLNALSFMGGLKNVT